MDVGGELVRLVDVVEEVAPGAGAAAGAMAVVRQGQDEGEVFILSFPPPPSHVLDADGQADEVVGDGACTHARSRSSRDRGCATRLRRVASPPPLRWSSGTLACDIMHGISHRLCTDPNDTVSLKMRSASTAGRGGRAGCAARNQEQQPQRRPPH